MAFELAAGHAANVANGLGFGNVFDVRDVGFNANNSPLVERQRSGNAVTLFIDAAGDDTEGNEYAASVVAACASHTVYAVQCTAGDAAYCGSNAGIATITENASEYEVAAVSTTSTAGIKVTLTVAESCEITGTSAVTCTATVGGEAKGQKTATTATVTYEPAASLFFDVSITAGADKLANPTGKCSAAAPGANTRVVALWGLLGAIGAVGVLAL